MVPTMTAMTVDSAKNIGLAVAVEIRIDQTRDDPVAERQVGRLLRPGEL